MRIWLRKGHAFVAMTYAVVCVTTFFAGLTLSHMNSTDTRAIRVVRDTQALELVRIEASTNGNRLVFKNVSARDINGFVLAITGGGEITVDTSTGDRVIAPQAIEDLEIPASSDGLEITIRAVMFADGNVEEMRSPLHR